MSVESQRNTNNSLNEGNETMESVNETLHCYTYTNGAEVAW